jgi:hypothetical protein
MSVATAGLWVFIAVVAANVAGLSLDALLAWLSWPTITQLVTDYPALGLPIILVQVAGGLSLILHFYAR